MGLRGARGHRWCFALLFPLATISSAATRFFLRICSLTYDPPVIA